MSEDADKAPAAGGVTDAMVEAAVQGYESVELGFNESALRAALEAALKAQAQAPNVCKTCKGRGYVADVDVDDEGRSIGVYEDCPDCQAPDAEALQARVRELEGEVAALREDAERYRHVITRGALPRKTVAGYHYEDGVFHETPDAAIDAARADTTKGEGDAD